MPDKMSQEKIATLRAFGAKVVICPTAVEPDDPRSYYEVTKRIVAETPGAFHANQYHNPANPEAHYVSTAPEIVPPVPMPATNTSSSPPVCSHSSGPVET